MSAQGPIIFGLIQRLVSHREYAVEMVNSIIKDTDLDKCGEHATKDLGVSSFFDLARISIHRVYFHFFSFISLHYNHCLFVGNGKDEGLQDRCEAKEGVVRQ